MFGISPLGWVHTLGSLPAIPGAAYMFVRYGRIMPRSKAGIGYFVSMLIGGTTIFLIAHQPVSYGISVVTLICVLAGYGVGKLPILGKGADYIETACLSLSAFLLMVPTVSETLRRVPNGHPLVADPHSPILLGVMVALLIALVVGLAAQMIGLRRRHRRIG